MTTFDAHANLALAVVSAGSTVVGSTSGVTLVAESDEIAALFPEPPFNVTVWQDPLPQFPTAEIMRVTGFDGHRTFTVERGQEGTSALDTVSVGWRFADTVTAKTLTDVEQAINSEEAARAAGDATLQADISAEASARALGDAVTLASAEAHSDAGDVSTLATAEGYADTKVAAEAAARASADALLVPLVQKGAANGVAMLDSGGKVPTAQLPALAITDTYVVNSQAAMLALAAHTGDVCVRTDLNESFILAGTDPSILANWQQLLSPPSPVLSVAGKTGAVTLDEADVQGLTADLAAKAAGAASSTDGHLAQFSGASGKVLEDTGLVVDPDGTLAANSDLHVPTQKAVKTAIANSGSLTAVAVKTADYTANPGDLVPVDTTAASRTITLPTAAAAGARPIAIKHVIQGSTNTVTVACAGSDVFNKAGGSASLTLTLLNQGVVLVPDATRSLWIVSSDDLALSQLDARYDAAGTATSAVATEATARASADATHAALTTTAHGGIVASTDSRLTDQRTPLDNSVTSAKIVDGAIMNADINASAAIAISKLADPGAGKVVGSSSGAAAVFPPGYEVAYVEMTSNFTTTKTTEATADTVISFGAVAFDGATVVEFVFYAPSAFQSSSGSGMRLALFEDGVSTGLICLTTPTDTQMIYLRTPHYTPSAGTHTYTIRAWTGAGTLTIRGGTRGSSGASWPAYGAIKKAI